MATVLPTLTVSVIYLVWDVCRRTQRPAAPPTVGARALAGDETLERRLDSLTLVVQPLPRRRR